MPTGPNGRVWATRSIGDTSDKYRLPPSRVERMHYSLGGHWLGHSSVSCVIQYTDLIRCDLVSVAVGRSALWTASSSLREPSPRLKPQDIFGAALGVWATALHTDPTKKALCLTRLRFPILPFFFPQSQETVSRVLPPSSSSTVFWLPPKIRVFVCIFTFFNFHILCMYRFCLHIKLSKQFYIEQFSLV